MSELQPTQGAVLLPKITQGLSSTAGAGALGAPGAIDAAGVAGVVDVISDQFADISAGLRLDLTLNETATVSAQVTPFPVEDGAEVTDHVTPQSRTYSISGVHGDFEPGAGEAEPGRARALYNRLDSAVSTGELFTLITDLRVYENVILVNVSASRSQGGGFALPISIQTQEVRFATSEEVFLPPPTKAPGAGSQKDKNRRGTKVPPDADINESILSTLGAQKAGGGFLRTIGFEGAIVDIGGGL